MVVVAAGKWGRSRRIEYVKAAQFYAEGEYSVQNVHPHETNKGPRTFRAIEVLWLESPLCGGA
jgi:hypothetical protein